MCRLSLPGISLLLLSGMVFVLVSGGLREALSLERSRYGRTLATVQANARVDDALLFYGPWQEVQLRYYDPGGLPPIVKLPPQAPPLLDPAQAEPVLERLFALSTRRVWVLPASVADVDPEGFVADWLTTHTHTVWRTDDFALHLPALGAGRPFQELDLTFGSNLDLESIVFEGSVVPAGEPFRFTLYWRPSAPLEHDVRVSLSLVDEGGRVWGVRENVPGEWGARPSAWQPGERIADYEGFVLPQGAPAGRYTVRLSVRDNETGDTLLVAGRRDVELVSLWVAPPIYPPVLTDEDQSDWIAFCDPEGVECVTLVGCEPGGVRFQQGYAVPFSLNWLTPDTLSADVRVRLTLASRGPWPWRERAVLATRDVALPERSLSRLDVLASELLDEAPYSAFLPMAQVDRDLTPMQRDSVFWGQRLLTLIDAIGLPVDVPTGQASVELEVLGTDGTAWVTATGAHGVSLFDITIEGRPVQRRLPAGLEGVEVDFGEEVGLRGYRIEGDPRPGGEVRITYGWYARTRPTAIYAVFNHLMTVDGKPVAQKDGWPQDGRLLTTGWQVGEYIEDHYVLSIPTDAPPGPYRLHAGMYNAATGVRTSAHQENVRLTNDELVLEVTGNR